LGMALYYPGLCGRPPTGAVDLHSPPTQRAAIPTRRSSSAAAIRLTDSFRMELHGE
jgi:hypothetical protein